jgi:G:T-mismatch repair DNA endonuclease (very short patch repair protein)
MRDEKGRFIKGKMDSEIIERRNVTRKLNGWHSVEAKQNISLSRIGKEWVKDNGKKMGLAYGGKTTTASSRIKNSLDSKKRWENPMYRARMEIIHSSQRMKELHRIGALRSIRSIKNKRFHNTKPELEMQKILDEIGIIYIHPYPVWNIEHKYPADFYIPQTNTILEVDGKYWHKYPIGLEIDKIRNSELMEKGYKVVRFWENEFDKEKIKEAIQC